MSKTGAGFNASTVCVIYGSSVATEVLSRGNLTCALTASGPNVKQISLVRFKNSKRYCCGETMTETIFFCLLSFVSCFVFCLLSFVFCLLSFVFCQVQGSTIAPIQHEIIVNSTLAMTSVSPSRGPIQGNLRLVESQIVFCE